MARLWCEGLRSGKRYKIKLYKSLKNYKINKEWIINDFITVKVCVLFNNNVSVCVCVSAGRSDRAQMKADLSKINSVISEHTLHLSPYQFLTAFSQLISRICHSSDEVFAVLMDIIAKVFLAYPQQAMWMMTAVSKVRDLPTIISDLLHPDSCINIIYSSY